MAVEGEGVVEKKQLLLLRKMWRGCLMPNGERS